MKKEIFADYLNLEWCNIYLATISILQSNLMQFFFYVSKQTKDKLLNKNTKKNEIYYFYRIISRNVKI